LIVKRLLGLVVVIVLVGGYTASPSKSSAAASGCLTSIEPRHHAQEPHDVAVWAHGKPVIGGGSLWTIRSAVSVPAVQYGTGWHLKFPWYARPIGRPHIEGRRLDGPGTFHFEMSRADAPAGSFEASNTRFLSSGMLGSHRPVRNLKFAVQFECRARVSRAAGRTRQ
jgi:hypothetical protein